MATSYNAYIDIPTLLPLLYGISAAQYVSGNTISTAALTVGETSLPVQASAGFTEGQLVYILDGPNSEICLADAINPTPNGTTLVLAAPGLAFAHSARASISSAGSAGCLAATILTASAWMENHCQQGTLGARDLFSASRTEKLYMPDTRAYVNMHGTLTVVPTHFPIDSVASCSIEFSPQTSIAIDTTLAEIDIRKREVYIPYTQSRNGLISPSFLDGPPVRRDEEAWVSLTYTAGIQSAPIPFEILMAMSLIVQEFLSYAMNPTGAAIVNEGGVQVVQRFRTSGNSHEESSFDSIFIAQAKVLLRQFSTMVGI